MARKNQSDVKSKDERLVRARKCEKGRKGVFGSKFGTVVRPLAVGTTRRSRVSKLNRVLCRVSLLLLLLIPGCSSETLFKSNFDANAVNQPPAHAQEVGTAKYRWARGKCRGRRSTRLAFGKMDQDQPSG